MKVWKEAWHQMRLYAAQIAIGWAVDLTPAKTPHIHLLYDMILKWKELG